MCISSMYNHEQSMQDYWSCQAHSWVCWLMNQYLCFIVTICYHGCSLHSTDFMIKVCTCMVMSSLSNYLTKVFCPPTLAYRFSIDHEYWQNNVKFQFCNQKMTVGGNKHVVHLSFKLYTYMTFTYLILAISCMHIVCLLMGGHILYMCIYIPLCCEATCSRLPFCNRMYSPKKMCTSHVQLRLVHECKKNKPVLGRC